MADKRDAEVITLGSGDVFAIEYDSNETLPDMDTMCIPENLLGRIKGGATLTYEGEWYVAKDDTGRVTKTCLTEETVTFATGLITWNGETLEKLVSTARVTDDEDKGLRTVKIGGIDNFNGKSYLIAFHHTDKKDGDVWILVRGQNQGSVELAFTKDEETTVDAEFTVLSQDEEGTLITYIEQASTGSGVSSQSVGDYDGMTVTELKAYCDEHGIAYTTSMIKAEIIAAIQAAE